MEIIWFILGIVIGGLAVYIAGVRPLFKRRQFLDDQLKESNYEKNNLTLQNQVFKDHEASLKKDIENLKNELSLEREKVIQLNKSLSSSETDLKNLHQKLNDQKKEVSNLQEKFYLEFKNLANEIFDDKSKKFTDQNKVNLDEILAPLKEKIVSFEKKIDVANKESLSWNASLKEQIHSLKELNQQITKEAENLTKALKGDTKSQGSWGEFILESILEKSGLEKEREFFIQQSLVSENGKRLQPDVIIKLPESKHIIIDAKVSLVAYERYFNAEDEQKKSEELKYHLQSIKNHIKNLSAKNYQQLYGVKSLDFVLLFIPVEPAFSLAIQHDVNLFNEAFERNIVIVSPSTLLATLRTIASIWRQEYQNRNALEIAKQGGDLYDKFVGFVEDLQDLGQRINTTQDTYHKAMNKLSEGRGNLINRAEKIKKLGANAGKSLPLDLIEKSLKSGEEDF